MVPSCGLACGLSLPTGSLTRQASSNTPTLLVPAAHLTWSSGLPIIPNNGVPHPLSPRSPHFHRRSTDCRLPLEPR
ncbi:hypothetical protein CORC01_11175 [Colletotrichum orchidophilum]|uniref:Uncharacterized protein n=1 Tax=Colletotrichum orchidophilum TaxID=1209926 RepID=A0A1G4AWF2_9PEZI|nr:uncharacterized protein CORC01_11175 [Colletotrichum orchidophilum]OHE93489.1 hypothetical protein CORC01_11175 [Colletotrichum orchidophilum]